MQTKKEYRYFSIFDHKKEEEYLRSQHKNGWKFVKVTGLGTYHFDKCEPEDVVYQLDYNNEKTCNKDEYIKMFEDCGWEYLQQFAGYSYFSKRKADMADEEEIFSDDSSRLAMMERVLKARLLPLLVIFCAFILPQFVINLNAGRYLLAAFMGGILLIYVALFVLSGVKYYRQKNESNRK